MTLAWRKNQLMLLKSRCHDINRMCFKLPITWSFFSISLVGNLCGTPFEKPIWSL